MIMNGLELQLFRRMEPHFSLAVEQGFGEVLVGKHLYQNLRVRLPAFELVQEEMKRVLAGVTSGGITDIGKTAQFVYDSISLVEWSVNDPHRRTGLLVTSELEGVAVSLGFTPPSVKLYCGVCKRIEAYNFQFGQDLLEQFREPEAWAGPVSEQVFSLAYQCQSCKSVPEIFMVRRDKTKLTQSGRAPMEQIAIPSFLPKTERKLFSDAMIALNSGQVLAGNFLLRAFVEQYVRSMSVNPDSQDTSALFTEYGSCLPDDFKQRFPSLSSIYDALSVDIHKAAGSEDVFTRAMKDIIEHFDAKRLFRISDSVPSSC